MGAKSIVITIVVTLFLATTPPTSTLVNHVARQLNPLAALVHVQTTLTSHNAFVATTAVKLGLFDALHDAGVEADSAASAYFRFGAAALLDPFGIVRHAFGAPTSCIGAADIAQRIRIPVAPCQALLDALASMDLVEACGGDSDGLGTYRNALASEWFAVGKDSIADMAQVSNHEAVVVGLARLDTYLRDEQAGVQSADSWRADLGSLWAGYAEHSGGFSKTVAAKVSSAVSQALPGRGAGHVVLDVGCGSGIYSLELAALQPQARFVLVDLEAPLGVAATRARAVNPDDYASRFAFVGGSVFDNATTDAVCNVLRGFTPSVVTIMMNSFAQHFSPTQVVDTLQKIAGCVGTIETRIVVTELVRPAGPYSMFRELVPMPRVFDFVLRSIARHGEMRTEAEYVELVRAGTAVFCDTDKQQRPVVTASPCFPMPASIVIGVCH
jgi:SAM-dependent methyltransferase